MTRIIRKLFKLFFLDVGEREYGWARSGHLVIAYKKKKKSLGNNGTNFNKHGHWALGTGQWALGEDGPDRSTLAPSHPNPVTTQIFFIKLYYWGIRTEAE